MRRDHARAWRLLEESLAIHRDLADVWGVSHSPNLAFLAFEAGDAETAHTLLAEALAIERKSGHQPRLANALEMAARLPAGDGEPALAIRLYARAAELRERMRGLTFEVGWPDPTPNLDDLRSRVGEDAFAEEWARGRAMSIIEAIDQAMKEQRELEPDRASVHRGWGRPCASRPASSLIPTTKLVAEEEHARLRASVQECLRVIGGVAVAQGGA